MTLFSNDIEGIEEVDAVISTIGGSVANPKADSEVRDCFQDSE